MVNIIQPVWPAPKSVFAGVTTRHQGFSHPPYDSLNLATHVGDNASHVINNRCNVNRCLARTLTTEPDELRWQWLDQTHSTTVIQAREDDSIVTADACWTAAPLTVCTVLTADCLPILLADRKSRCVAAIHAGWRGLSQGIVHNTVSALCSNLSANHADAIKPIDLLAWLGPAIGPGAFEVGSDVVDAFLLSAFAQKAHAPAIRQAFQPHPAQHDKYLCDIYQLACVALNSCGVKQIYGGGFCTVTQKASFFSYRREKTTGRMASFIMLKPSQ